MFLLLLVTAVLFALLLTRKTIWVVRKALRPDLSRFKRKGKVQPEATENSGNDAIHPESAETVEEPELRQPEEQQMSSQAVATEEEEKAEEASEDTTARPFEQEEDEEPSYLHSSHSNDTRDARVVELEPTIAEPVASRPTVTVETTSQPSEPSFEISDEIHEDDEMLHGELTQPYNPRYQGQCRSHHYPL